MTSSAAEMDPDWDKPIVLVLTPLLEAGLGWLKIRDNFRQWDIRPLLNICSKELNSLEPAEGIPLNPSEKAQMLFP